jgi:hypothetical protein
LQHFPHISACRAARRPLVSAAASSWWCLTCHGWSSWLSHPLIRNTPMIWSW